MAVNAQRVNVGTTAVNLTDQSADYRYVHHILVANRGTGPVYLGPAGVTASTGFELAAGDSFSGDLNHDEHMYAIAATGSHTVHVFRSGV